MLRRGGPGLHAKNQVYHQLIEMKFCMSHYRHKNIPDAKFEFCSSSIFEDATSQTFPPQEGNKSSHLLFIPGK